MLFLGYAALLLCWTYCTAQRDINCDVPEIPNGYVHSPKQSYKESEILRFSCNDGYSFGERSDALCTETGWDPPPYCTAKLCDYPVIENGKLSNAYENNRHSYFPMRFGQSVDYYCFQDYSTPTGNTWVRSFCSETGWSPAPKCLKKCYTRQLINGYFPRHQRDFYKEGETATYACNNYYRAEHKEVTCTGNGWSPPPRCILKCQYMYFENGYFTTSRREYRLKKVVSYRCHPGFVTAEGQDKGETQCQENGWTPPPKCIKMSCGSIPKVANAQFEGRTKETYEPGETIRYECDGGFLIVGSPEIHCKEGNWTAPPFCEGKGGKCGPPPTIENGELLSFPRPEYQQGTTLEYKCPSFYVLKGSQYITCTDGQWSSPPVCLVPCTASEEDMDRNNIELKGSRETKLYVSSGDYIEFRCKAGYVKEQEPSHFRVQCVEGVLDYPRCRLGRNCTVSTDHMESNNIQLQSRQSRTSTYRSGDFIFFECKSRYRQVSRAEKFRAQCLDGVITYPTCRKSWFG